MKTLGGAKVIDSAANWFKELKNSGSISSTWLNAPFIADECVEVCNKKSGRCGPAE